MKNNLAVSEIFGPTFQGEGKNIGMPCIFLRLAGCNLKCQWCDTPYTWDWKRYDPKSEVSNMPVEHVINDIQNLGHTIPRNLVISGGEPMLQQLALSGLIDRLHSQGGWWVEIETAGTLSPIQENHADQFTVSLKLDNSGNARMDRYRIPAIHDLAHDPRSIFKFVVMDMKDFGEIDEICKTFMLDPSRVYIMPEGITPQSIQEHAQAIAQSTLDRGYHLTTRLQILLYGNQRRK